LFIFYAISSTLLVMSSREPELVAFGEVAASAEHLRLLTDNMPALIAYFGMKDLCCQFANAAYAKTYGFDTHSIIGKNVREIIGDEAFRTIRPYIERAFAMERVSYERALTTPDGQERIIEVNLIPHANSTGAGVGVFVMINDVTKFRRAESAMRESEERFGKFADASNEAIVFFDAGLITDVNEAGTRMMRASREQMLGHPVLDFVVPECRETVAHHIRSGYEQPYEGAVVRADGTTIAVELVGKVIMYKGKTLRMTVVRDIRDRKENEARIHFLAHHDPLTHLPNRAMLMERLHSLVEAGRRQSKQVAVLFLDIDNFKTINDSLGHYAGDVLLKSVAQRLKDSLRSVDLVGRLGGDEFLLAITDLNEPEDVVPAVEKIAEVIKEPFAIEGEVFTVSSSIGISVFPKDGDTPDELIRNADAAMYFAKDRGRSNFQFFTPSLQQSAHHALALESGIRKAIKQTEFVLYYQPEVRSKTGVITSLEALVRWQHPELGLLGPDKFISVAENRGLIVPLGHWVINEAIRQAREWLDLGVRVPVAVNLSAVQFKQKGLVEDIAACLSQHGLPGELLELELTESLFMEDVAAVTKTLNELKDLRVTLAVDDFGTGYSSLSYLKRYPIDKIKIDRSFIRDIPNDKDDIAITIAIINLAESLGLRVVAEGVETTEQVEFLEYHHCDYIQGYLISHPLPPVEMLSWLRRRY
jgi:diguanylate cyclase (GGDEF)-like protein/PAS domain S-box-containing protein